jgi:hypothetical protein
VKKIIVIFVIGTVAFIFVGFILVQLKWLDQGLYLKIATITGGLASAIGMLSLLRPTITMADIRSLEQEAFRNVSDLADELQKAETDKVKTQAEILRLEARKKEMEILVRKASMSVFLKTRLEQMQERTREIVNGNSELKRLIDDYPGIEEKLLALDEGIEKDENVSLLRGIISEAERRHAQYDIEFPGLFGSIFSAYVRSIRKLAK